MTLSPTSPWFVRARRSIAPRARLFCFPYAGGSSSIYSRWHLGLPPDIDVCAVELPGRGTRFRPATFATDMEALIDELSSEMAPLLDLPSYFFGHSMGALLAFSCARAVRRRGLRLPEHLFVSARMAPQHPNPDGPVPEMSDAQLIDLLRVRGGTAPQILAEPELMALLLPIIRADFGLLRSFTYTPELRLECPITVFGGTRDDRVSAAGLDDWRVHTVGPFAVEMIEGGHFFVDRERDVVVGRIATTIAAAGGEVARYRRVP